MLKRIHNKYKYWAKILERRRIAANATKGHQIHMYNWCNFWPPLIPQHYYKIFFLST